MPASLTVRPSVAPARRVGPVLRLGLLAAALAVLPLLSAHPAVQAQDEAVAPVAGISVIGYGKSSAPAETAVIQIVASEQEFGAPRPPDPDAVPGEAEREAVGPMVDALVAAGVAEDDIRVVVSLVVGLYYGPGGPGVTRVDVSVDDPTPERIDELLSAAVVGAAEEDLVVAQVGVGYGVADCAPLELEARRLALEDARTRAGLQADLLGVELGAPVATSDAPVNYSEAFSAYYGPFSPSGVACSPPAPVPTTGAPISAPPYDPTDQAEVNVYAQMSVTFAYEGTPSVEPNDAEATPTA